jgi:hypothetical protein
VTKRFPAAQGEVVFDDQFWPFVFVTWRGVPDLATVDAYFDAQQAATVRARAEGVRLVVVSDALEAENPPAVVRKRIAERSNAMRYEDAHAASFVVLSNPLVRGALTAIQWWSKSPMAIDYVASCEEAIERGLARLDALGVARPPTLSAQRYRRPTK